MDATAIEKIHQSATEAIVNLQLNNSGIPAVSIPKESKLESIEQFMLGRIRPRGVFTTTCLESFIKYVGDAGRSPCFISPAELKATAILNYYGDESTPQGHCDHVAVLKKEYAPEYHELISANGRAFSQREFAEWMEDYSYCINSLADSQGNDISLKQAINSVRQMKISERKESESSAEDFAASISSLASIEAKGKGCTLARFCVTTKPCDELSERSFACRVSVLTSGNSPAIKFRIVGLEKKKQEIAQEFLDLVRSAADVRIQCMVGTFVS